ncbi:hypothetical protein [Hoeflea prorocentri]|uniref:Uncharacterized protein n=1 Tax=Hoeflea prorocentri TaxID=1922333 RepID=A0A9X3UMA6_9HYPH|nr:hypothetical protein [Hoeflea prorocentri]MCY6381799.1 hypothetical protein [Hoeflea prorocentri]MDA5399599.1 hypothetical protein [Hoeflea prorocentri]
MRNKIFKSALAAIVLVSALGATQASAKIKEVKFHFVKSAYEDYPVYEMKFQNGKWVWANKGRAFKPRMKYRIRQNKGGIAHHVVDAEFLLEGVLIGSLSHIKNKSEKLVTLNIGSNVMKGQEKAARAACNAHGGGQKVVRDLGLKGQLSVKHTHFGKHEQTVKRSSVMTAKVVCHGKGPKRTGNSTVAMKLKGLKLYTIPARPKCGKPVKMVAEFHTTRPGKVEFLYYRGDGEKQKASVTTSRGGGGFSKRWAKTYKFNKTTNRKYKVVAIGHKGSTQWIPLKVNCTKGAKNFAG